MPEQRRCLLTLNRSDWLKFVSALRRTRIPNCIKAAAAIETELGDRESMGMDREIEKWDSIIGPAFNAGSGPEREVFSRVIPRVSEADWKTGSER